MTPLMGADLNNIVKTQKLTDDHVQFLIYQVLRGLKYIHSAGIIHRVRHQAAAYSHFTLTARIIALSISLSSSVFFSDHSVSPPITSLIFFSDLSAYHSSLCLPFYNLSLPCHYPVPALNPHSLCLTFSHSLYVVRCLSGTKISWHIFH